jgi:hypothetical protein
VLVQRREVADHGVGKAGVDVVLPGPPGVGAGVEVELVEDPPPRVGVVAERALQHRVQPLAVDASGHALEPAAGGEGPGVRIGEEGVLRRLDARQRHRRLQHLAGGVDVEQERAKLLTEPEAAVLGPSHRLQVEVGPGQQPIRPEERERDLPIGVAQLEEAEHRHRPGAPSGAPH